LGFFEFTAWVPAYTLPETPVGLNADPRADTECPGVTIVTSHDWFGCPVIPAGCGFPARAIPPNAQDTVNVVINFGFIPIESQRLGPRAAPEK